MGFFFQFHRFTWNNLPLSFVIFSVFFLFGYYDGGLVKLTWVSSRFFWSFFFNFVLFARCFFWISFFFILILYYWLWVYQVRPSWLRFISSTLYFYFYFYFSIFDIRLVGFELYNFFLISFCRLFWFYIMSCTWINLT